MCTAAPHRWYQLLWVSHAATASPIPHEILSPVPDPRMISQLIQPDAFRGRPGQSFPDHICTGWADKCWNGLHPPMHDVAQRCCHIARAACILQSTTRLLMLRLPIMLPSSCPKLPTSCPSRSYQAAHQAPIKLPIKQPQTSCSNASCPFSCRSIKKITPKSDKGDESRKTTFFAWHMTSAVLPSGSCIAVSVCIAARQSNGSKSSRKHINLGTATSAVRVTLGKVYGHTSKG